jgi:hypothetical protein
MFTSKMFAYRPKVHLLESRLQPGSMLNSGVDTSLVAGALLGDVLGGMAQTQSMAVQASAESAGGQVQTSQDAGTVVSAPSQLTNSDTGTVSTLAPVDSHLAVSSPAALASALGVSRGGEIHQPLIPSNALYYTGDCNHINGLASEFNSLVSDARTYDNFQVPDGQYWRVTSIFGHDYMSYTATTANWEIRTGITNGSGGTLLYSGTADPMTMSPDGCNDFGYIGQEVVVTPSVQVNLLPGNYYITIAPVGSGSGRAFVETANSGGPNSVGQPNTVDDSWFDSSYFNLHWVKASSQVGAPANFSYGVVGGARPM